MKAERTIVHALVDSGATISLFHTCIADDAGIDLEDAEQVYLAGIGGYIKAYVKKQVKASIEGLGKNHNTNSVYRVHCLRYSNTGSSRLLRNVRDNI